uniref:Uncharacterized protein n=1 Tax=Caldicellulosiruptor owensensis TaxID=55205 RepID=A0A7C5V5X4_9FIRM
MYRVVFYKKISSNRCCDNCGKEKSNYKVVRVVDWDKSGNGLSYVAGHNMSASYYCSMRCLREREIADETVKVRRNTIEEINALGYWA